MFKNVIIVYIVIYCNKRWNRLL